ncbi:SAM-dependent methyltransferase [Actinomadura viridis]|uniref:SAM-dependent MidA family methyltransferase n=1 Tax=Actinomadura viridis TaxID=58110 RepID=A0A931GGW6_9ACTN|nr:SAM-dependent methyltransferase [Actinomadura viridis]MBG6086207.1 SAM-dependent MidA family methyltransferase [Actinomadura viridis]
MAAWVTWRTAMERALYGPGGFYRRGERPAEHFRTSVHASERFAAALARLLVEVDAALGRPPRLDLVDVGAGSGRLLVAVAAHLPPDTAARLAPAAVEIAPRPAGLPAAIRWLDGLPDAVTGMVIANEWLDNVPIDVVEQGPDGPHTVLVDPVTGAERAGPPPAAEDAAWLERWWPLREPGDRAEVGAPRCGAWASVVGRLRAGLAVAMDYSHTRGARPVYGTLTGYRDGATVPAVPDGSCDVTAHVALDACVAAGARAGAAATLLTTQREALRALGLSGRRPPAETASSDPRGYVAALCAAGEEAELIDPGGLGGFGWLVQTAGVPLPPSLSGLAGGSGSVPGESSAYGAQIST